MRRATPSKGQKLFALICSAWKMSLHMFLSSKDWAPRGIKTTYLGGLGRKMCGWVWKHFKIYFQRWILFFFKKFFKHLLCFSKLSCTESTAPITLISNVNILTNSVGLLYLSFKQMYNLTPPGQLASPHHSMLLSLEFITWSRIVQFWNQKWVCKVEDKALRSFQLQELSEQDAHRNFCRRCLHQGERSVRILNPWPINYYTHRKG